MGVAEILFILSAAYALASAVGVLASKHTVYAALYFVSHLMAVAVIYALLNAPLIAVLQVMVYAGAVMILFLFAIMILDASVLEKINPMREKAHWVVGGIMAAALTFLFSSYAGGSKVVEALAPGRSGDMPATTENVKGIALLLFRDHVLSFELVGILLLVAVVGVIVLAKRRLEV